MCRTIVKFIFVSLVSLVMVPTAFALGGGGASSTEPGDSCERTLMDGSLFKRATGAPFSGEATATYAAGEVNYGGTITQFGSGCAVTFAGFQEAVVKDDFDTFSGRDLKGLCLQVLSSEGDCSATDSIYMEVLTGRNPTRDIPGVATIEIMAYPLRDE